MTSACSYQGRYETWLPAEENPNRLDEVDEKDTVYKAEPNQHTVDNDATEKNLNKRIRSLRTVLSLIGKCVTQGHYTAVTKHSTSMKSIYSMLRRDYDIQQRGIHFLNILDLKYDEQKTTPVAFYNQYRTQIVNNLAAKNDVIKYKDGYVMKEAEKMSPMIEDLILLNVLKEIEARLPSFVKTHYHHKMKDNDRLMDFKTDILNNISTFLGEIDKNEHMNMLRGDQPTLQAFQSNNRGGRRSNFTAPGVDIFCKVCNKAKLPRSVFKSHYTGESSCPTLTQADYKQIIKNQKMGSINYQKKSEDESEVEEENQVTTYCSDNVDSMEAFFRSKEPNLNFIKTLQFREPSLSFLKSVPTQILTVYSDKACTEPIHMDMDSGATLNYARLAEVVKLNCAIQPNGQLSTLGDGISKLKSVGEIDITFFRNNWTVRYRALVCKDLQAAFIGGTLFMVDNHVVQDISKGIILIHDKKYTVPETSQHSIVPVTPATVMGLAMGMKRDTSYPASSSPTPNPAPCSHTLSPPQRSRCKEISRSSKNSNLIAFKSIQVVLPGQELTVKTKYDDNTEVVIEAWHENLNSDWPQPQLAVVQNGNIEINNDTHEPLIMGKDIKQIKLSRTVPYQDPMDKSFYEPQPPSLMKILQKQNFIDEIKLGENIEEQVREMLNKAHEKHTDVFNKDLTGGYNEFYGKHRCQLNWAGKERPLANKVTVPNYNHDLKGLQQELMDELTEQEVLLVPQEHDIVVQAVCPSFLQRKQRAKHKPQHLLTKDDVRLLINFGPVNDKIKPLPADVPKTNDIIIMLGRWKELILFDLYNGYFQIKMADESIPWLGVQTPFGGMRVIARSGQGLMGQAEEFNEVLSKVLKEEMKEGICVKIVDDVYVGGKNQKEAAQNYVRILQKLDKANLKITPSKTHIFPTSVDVLGWVWKKGGFLSPSPHRQCALQNVKEEDIKKVRHMRSWIGLYKTLHIATPKITGILDPFEKAMANKDSMDKFEWNHTLQQQFRVAKNHVDKIQTLYLPSPDDQLLMEPDGSKMTPGIGHVLYAMKDGKKLPVRFHTFKLKESCRKWSPCEIEALAFGTGIEKEMDLLRESNHPLIICPDSKPVHQALDLINKGHFSASSRMSNFLTNANRIKLISKHISGKAKLNPMADLQSRATSECNAEICSIHKFVDEAVDGVIDNKEQSTGRINICKADIYSNKNAWKTAQDNNPACTFTKGLLTSGKPPPKAAGKTSGDYYNEVRAFCREVTLAPDGLLVVKAKPDLMSGNIPRNRIVIPTPLVQALLWHLHNHNDEHPTKSQLKVSFQRGFFALQLDKHLDEIYRACYKCQVLQKMPREMTTQMTRTEVSRPQEYFHADVIKRSCQIILTVKDHFSSLQDAMLLESEQSKDLKKGLIRLTSAMRRPGTITIGIDNAPGFKALKEDSDLKHLEMNLHFKEDFNNNYNAVVDRGCQELEEELKRISPEAQKITEAELAKAVLNLNTKLRRRGNISAIEIHTARDLFTGENLKLSDQDLREEQVKARTKSTEKTATPISPILTGDTVVVKNSNDKHKARDMFIVTAKDGDKVKAQKVLHPLSDGNAKFMVKEYHSNQKHLKTVFRPKAVTADTTVAEEPNDDLEPTFPENVWTAIDPRFFNAESDDDDEQADDTRNTKPTDRANTIGESSSESEEEILNSSLEERIRADLLTIMDNDDAHDEDVIHDETNNDPILENDADDQQIIENNDDEEDVNNQQFVEYDNNAVAAEIDDAEHIVIIEDGNIDVDDNVATEIEAEANDVIVAGNIDEENTTPRRSRRTNKGRTARYEDFERGDPENLLHSSNNVSSYQATPVTSDADRSLDWDNYASEPTFLATSTGLMDRRITRSFNVDDLNLSSDTTSSSVFELQPVSKIQEEDEPEANDEAETEEDDEPPPPLPQRSTRNFSVINCSRWTCKQKRSSK